MSGQRRLTPRTNAPEPPGTLRTSQGGSLCFRGLGMRQGRATHALTGRVARGVLGRNEKSRHPEGQRLSSVWFN